VAAAGSAWPPRDALADRVKAKFGTAGALFANAGVNGFAPFEETSGDLFDRLLAINVKGRYFTVVDSSSEGCAL
jgi:NAD(P)-dependent dehydrogenase (short-subunit alcohol dehydrogenase family)